jgi:hypothetical protein
MSIYGDPVLLGGSGRSIPKTITENGIYHAAADQADGYDPVTVHVGADRTLLADWDFTGADPLTDKVGGKVLENHNSAVTFSAQGAYFAANVNVEQGLGQYRRLMISKADLLGAEQLYGCDIEVDVGSFHKTEWGSSNAVRFVMTNQSDGFCGQQASSVSARGWSFYSISNWSTKHNPTPSFENCTVKISVATENTLDIAYIDGLDFVGNDRESIAASMTMLALGNSAATCIGGIYIKAMRVYRREALTST